MLIHMRTQDLDMVGTIQRHLERRVRAALGSSATHVHSVTLEFSDVNGPRGGADLRCAITVDVIPRGSVRAEATSSDLLSALGRALARARRSVLQAARRERRLRTQGSVPLVRVGREDEAGPAEARRVQ
jgi:hypothetical protein